MEDPPSYRDIKLGGKHTRMSYQLQSTKLMYIYVLGGKFLELARPHWGDT